ncbi:MAG: hypothetical protein ACXV8Q_00190 [Methylobacter sp.]
MPKVGVGFGDQGDLISRSSLPLLSANNKRYDFRFVDEYELFEVSLNGRFEASTGHSLESI